MCPNILMIKCLRAGKRTYHHLGVRHLVLITVYLAYLCVGATLFFTLEHENEKSVRLRWNMNIRFNRSTFIKEEIMPLIFNNSDYLVFINSDKTKNFQYILEEQFESYERKLNIHFPHGGVLDWDFPNALLYSATLATTIGYGFIYPLTSAGKVASMIYTLIGIPFTLILLRDLSGLVATLLNYPGMVVVKCWDLFRFCTLKTVDSMEDLKSERQTGFAKYFHDSVLRIPAPVAFFALLGWIFAGAFVFCVWETNWTTLQSFYFCFNSLTTLGVGDVVPEHPNFLLLMFLYIYVGLAVVSLFIDLIYAKLLLAYTPSKSTIMLSSNHMVDNLGIGRAPYALEQIDSNGIYDTLTAEDFEGNGDLGSCVTLGILQMNRRLHEQEIQRKTRLKDTKGVQTTVTVPVKRLVRVDHEGNSLVLLPSSVATSSDDVNRLMRETYDDRERGSTIRGSTNRVHQTILSV